MSTDVIIAYFSGTGGTRRIAEHFMDAILEKGKRAALMSLDPRYRDGNKEHVVSIADDDTRLILLYAVHEMDAPRPVFDFIDDLNEYPKMAVSVISVSGGGEVWPNTGCRVNVIRMLEEKGHEVFHERMMVMPSNILVYTKKEIALRLLAVLPEKTRRYADEILDGKTLRNEKRGKMMLFSTRSKSYARYLRKAGRRFFTTGSCSRCQWCVENCPTTNISMADGRIQFAENCILCLRCVYGCPRGAIQHRGYAGILKKGYSLAKLEENLDGHGLTGRDAECEGMLWIGVKRYLTE